MRELYFLHEHATIMRKRISIRAADLRSEKFLEAKPAHPTFNLLAAF